MIITFAYMTYGSGENVGDVCVYMYHIYVASIKHTTTSPHTVELILSGHPIFQ